MMNDKECKISNEVPMNAFTHGGKFHADDVFGTALLLYLNPEIKIQRGFHVPEDFDGIVFDIGFGEFDHHQEDKKVRENGVAYAAFGLLWEKFGEQILSKEEAKHFDEKFIQPLDICDNNGDYNEVACIIGLFNPAWDSDEDSNDTFFEAVTFASKILELKFAKYHSVQRAKKIVTEAIEKQQDGIMILEKGAPWRQFVQGTPIEFIIYPSFRGGFNAQAVEETGTEDKSLKCPFPEEWRGKMEKELQEISQIPSIYFCHNSGFLIATHTMEDAILACNKAREIKTAKQKEMIFD